MTSDGSNDVLRNALAKREQGRGLKNSEITAIRHYEQALVKSDRAPISRRSPAPVSEATMVANRDTLARSTGADAALAARVAVLEALLSGLTRQTITYCSGGSSSSKTILMS